MARKSQSKIGSGDTINFWESIFIKIITKLLLIGFIVFVLLTVFSGP